MPTSALAVTEQLLPSRRGFDGADPIFSMNAAAQRYTATGRPVINAAMGALLDDEGGFVTLDTVMNTYSELTRKEIAPYAPIAGDPHYLLAITQRHWPTLERYGVGVATPGGSGALSTSLRNLLEPGQRVLTHAPYWGPYQTIAEEHNIGVATAPFPLAGEQLDVDAWRAAGRELLDTQGRLVIWLNEPCQNPTGASLTAADRATLIALLEELSQHGPVTLVLDIAYADYARDPADVREAFDAYAAMGERGDVLLGACLSLSKGYTLYGARAGALVFPWCEDQALQQALSTSCRGVFSNCARAPMSVLLRISKDQSLQQALAAEHAHWRASLAARADALDAALRAEGQGGAHWDGGFFVGLGEPDAEAVSGRLMEQGVFVVPLQNVLRVGICGLRVADATRFAQTLREARLA